MALSYIMAVARSSLTLNDLIMQMGVISEDEAGGGGMGREKERERSRKEKRKCWRDIDRDRDKQKQNQRELEEKNEKKEEKEIQVRRKRERWRNIKKEKPDRPLLFLFSGSKRNSFSLSLSPLSPWFIPFKLPSWLLSLLSLRFHSLSPFSLFGFRSPPFSPFVLSQ